MEYPSSLLVAFAIGHTQRKPMQISQNAFSIVRAADDARLVHKSRTAIYLGQLSAHPRALGVAARARAVALSCRSAVAAHVDAEY